PATVELPRLTKPGYPCAVHGLCPNNRYVACTRKATVHKCMLRTTKMPATLNDLRDRPPSVVRLIVLVGHVFLDPAPYPSQACGGVLTTYQVRVDSLNERDITRLRFVNRPVVIRFIVVDPGETR